MPHTDWIEVESATVDEVPAESNWWRPGVWRVRILRYRHDNAHAIEAIHSLSGATVGPRMASHSLGTARKLAAQLAVVLAGWMRPRTWRELAPGAAPVPEAE